jgi:hypothetical protein
MAASNVIDLDERTARRATEAWNLWRKGAADVLKPETARQLALAIQAAETDLFAAAQAAGIELSRRARARLMEVTLYAIGDEYAKALLDRWGPAPGDGTGDR